MARTLILISPFPFSCLPPTAERDTAAGPAAAEEGNGDVQCLSPEPRAALACAWLRRAVLGGVPLRDDRACGHPHNGDRAHHQIRHGGWLSTATIARRRQQQRSVQRTARPLGRKPKCTCQHKEATMATPHDSDEHHGLKVSVRCP